MNRFTGAGTEPNGYPFRIDGRLKEPVSRWLWLVKWLLLIPHYVVLWFLFVAMVVLTVIAFFAVLFTGRYPRSIFDFNLGVLRWAWRVGFYGYNALGTDRYPPFSFDAVAEYPATLEVQYPTHLPRGLALVGWWLRGLPQYIIVVVLAGGTVITAHFGGVISVLAVVAGLLVLVTATYPPGLFDFVMGLNRWVFRVLTYALLMCEEYPPFRFDPGGPDAPPVPSTDPAAMRPDASATLLPHPPAI
jgi:hypothetical protein